MKAEILQFIPDSGLYAEVVFSLGHGQELWVLFEYEGFEWVGIFGQGYGKSKIIPISEKEVLVLAGGNAWWLNVAKQEAKLLEGLENLQDALLDLARNQVIVACQLYLYGINERGIQWKSSRLSWDGIRILEIKDDYLLGEYWDISDEWFGFKFDLESCRVVEGLKLD